MSSRLPVALVLAAFASIAAACGGSAPQPESQAAAPAAAEDHTQHAGGRVFFVQPTNGATVKSPVQFVFGSDQVTIAAVPPGELTTAREGMVHFHLGVDTDCLPAGEVIPKANPWIHFGDGKNVIEMQMTPGTHRFAVQAGDDLHATLAGLCETIEVTVQE
jgi:hypothetical protein